jgi:hypothetical protein
MWSIIYGGLFLGQMMNPLKWLIAGLSGPLSGPATLDPGLDALWFIQGQALLG